MRQTVPYHRHAPGTARLTTYRRTADRNTSLHELTDGSMSKQGATHERQSANNRPNVQKFHQTLQCCPTSLKLWHRPPGVCPLFPFRNGGSVKAITAGSLCFVRIVIVLISH